jgi:hypothetical protein
MRRAGEQLTPGYGRADFKEENAMDMQEKFTAAMRRLAEDRDLDLVVEHTYANSGFYSLQLHHSFEVVLRFPFDFHAGHSSFSGAVGESGPLGDGPRGGPWSCVRGREHDLVLARVKEVLDQRALGDSAMAAMSAGAVA